MWEKTPGNYPQNGCQALCDENPFCYGYNLGIKNSIGNPRCSIFADTGAKPMNQGGANGCYTKKNFVRPSSSRNTQNFGIIGIGLDGNDYYKPSLTESWQKLNNDSAGLHLT